MGHRPAPTDEQRCLAVDGSLTVATAVVVLYRNEHLDLSWLPDHAPLVLVHNDDAFDTESFARDNVRHVRMASNVGFGAAVNRALSLIETSRVVLVNPDARLTSAHWTELASAKDDEIVTVPQVDESGTPGIVASRYPTPVRHVLSAYRVGRWFPRGEGLRRSAGAGLRPGAAAPLVAFWTSGSCLSVATHRVRAVGGFDPAYFLYFEDVDLCRRLARAFPAMTVRVADLPAAIHTVGGSARSKRERGHVEAIRLASALTYASCHQTVGWAAARRAVALRRRPRGRSFRDSTTGASSPVLNDPTRTDAPPAVDVALLLMGRSRARGEARRAASWHQLLNASGVSVRQVHLLHECRRLVPVPGPREIVALARGQLAPEALAWSPRRARRLLRTLHPGVVLCQTTRAYSPLVSDHRVVLDFVDQLSASYRDRARDSTTLLGRWAFAVLAVTQRRLESTALPHVTQRVAAGRADATALEAVYLPIVIEPVADGADLAEKATPDTDLIFFGTLTYPPNQAALRFLASIWPELTERRPGITLVVAGAGPTDAIRALSERCGWELIADFESVSQVCARARVAVAPLPFTNGIQIKVLDAALYGVAQVVSPEAVAGLPPGLPAVVVPPVEFANATLALLDDDARRGSLAASSRSWIIDELSVATWTDCARGIVIGERPSFTPVGSNAGNSPPELVMPCDGARSTSPHERESASDGYVGA